MNGYVLFWAAVLLSLERACYAWAWKCPAAFRAVFSGPRALHDDPVDALRALFYVFKVLQVAVFVWWCLAHGDGLLPSLAGSAGSMAVGATLMIVGQLLNAAVFYQLGRVGVFYGTRFGYTVPWCSAFPFAMLKHPQYVGAVLSIWGFFVVTRFPDPDWYALPVLETIYYTLGAYLETGSGKPLRAEDAVNLLG